MSEKTEKAWIAFNELLNEDLNNLSHTVWIMNLDLAYRQKIICKAYRIMKKAFRILEKEINRMSD